MKSKRGGLLDSNLIGLILSVAVVAVLLILLFNLFAPSFDKGEKTAESYFKTLERAIETADSEGKGDFFIMENEKEDYYLVYFKNIASFEEVNRNFFRSKQGESVICVCYWRGLEATCNYCEDLKLPARYGEKEGRWVIGEGERIKISKREGIYDFVKIQ
ncbi:MAG: hypothetical protein ABIF18_03640 [archaeon]